MPGHDLRTRSIVVDYDALNSGKQKSRNSRKSEKTESESTMSLLDISNSVDMKKLEAEEEKLRIQIAVAEKQKQIQELQTQLAQFQPPNAPVASPLPKESSGLLNLKDLSKNKDLEDALNLLKDNHLDFLDKPAEPKIQPPQEKGKYFSIADFVTKPNQSSAANSDKVKRIEEVSPAQYMSANARILHKMIVEDATDTQDILKYLKYTAKVGDYLQTSDTSSVMLLDYEHRRQVGEEDREWDNIDSDKVYFHLKNRDQNRPQQQKPICIRYNKGGCTLAHCKYAHICMQCKGDHPRLIHYNATPAPSVHQGSAPAHPTMSTTSYNMPPPPPFPQQQSGSAAQHRFRQY